MDEFAGYVAVCANLTDGVLERMITVYFTTLNGSALGEELHKPFIRAEGDVPVIIIISSHF